MNKITLKLTSPPTSFVFLCVCACSCMGKFHLRNLDIIHPYIFLLCLIFFRSAKHAHTYQQERYVFVRRPSGTITASILEPQIPPSNATRVPVEKEQEQGGSGRKGHRQQGLHTQQPTRPAVAVAEGVWVVDENGQSAQEFPATQKPRKQKERKEPRGGSR